MINEPEPDHEGMELIMPFVTVVSQGGPHDDESYVAGFEMGALDATLKCGRPAVHELSIHTVEEKQADLIAMHRGYAAQFTESGVPGWTSAVFTRTEAPRP